MPTLGQNLVLPRCPFCQVANPHLHRQHILQTNDHAQRRPRQWAIYVCTSCGGVVSAWAIAHGGEIGAYYPPSQMINADVPERPRTFLQQALESLHAPAGAVMLAASAVDAMLKQKGLADGSLYARIEKAAADHIITADMAKWAHEVRLDANDQRHADMAVDLPSSNDAQRVIDFATSLAEIMFVLPARVQRGINPQVAT